MIFIHLTTFSTHYLHPRPASILTFPYFLDHLPSQQVNASIRPCHVRTGDLSSHLRCVYTLESKDYRLSQMSLDLFLNRLRTAGAIQFVCLDHKENKTKPKKKTKPSFYFDIGTLTLDLQSLSLSSNYLPTSTRLPTFIHSNTKFTPILTLIALRSILPPTLFASYHYDKVSAPC